MAQTQNNINQKPLSESMQAVMGDLSAKIYSDKELDGMIEMFKAVGGIVDTIGGTSALNIFNKRVIDDVQRALQNVNVNCNRLLKKLNAAAS